MHLHADLTYTNGGTMQEVVTNLEKCVKQSAFISNNSRKIGWDDYRRLYQNRRWDDWNWIQWASAKLEIDNSNVADLVENLKPVLDKFIDKKTGRLGNGLYLLWGGITTFAQPTIEDFAKVLIVAAVRAGEQKIADQLHGWINEKPLRYRYNVLLEGIELNEDLELIEGLQLTKIRTSCTNLPIKLPSLFTVDTAFDVIKMSVRCEMSPALYPPDGNNLDQIHHLRKETVLGSEQIPIDWLDSFCKSMSLASNNHVDWCMLWNDWDDLEAFANYPTHTTKTQSHPRNKTEISQTCLEKTRRIQLMLEKNKNANLNLAIDRWVRSKKSKSDTDKLIDLRIALEALHEIKANNEKAFRTANYGAWYIGETFEQRVKIRKTLHNTYSDASSVIHGVEPKHSTNDPVLIPSAQDICRKGILKRLRKAETPEWENIILGKRE